MVLIKEEVPADMVQYHEAPNTRPGPPSTRPLFRPYASTPPTRSQESYESQFQVPGYNPFGTSDEAGSPRASIARAGSADSDASDCWTPTSSRAPSEQPVLQEQNWAQGYALYAGTTRAGAASQGVNVPNQTLCDYQMQLMLLEQQNKPRCTITRRHQSAQLAGYGSGLTQLERENKARLMAATQQQVAHSSEQTRGNAQGRYEYQANTLKEQHEQQLEALAQRSQRLMDSPSGLGQSHALQEYNTQLRLLEQQNKKRLFITRQDPNVVPVPAVGGWNAQSDDELRSHLLKEHHKQQAMMGERSQDAQKWLSSRNHALQDYQMQLMLKDQREKQARSIREAQQNQDLVQQHARSAIWGAAAADYQKQLEFLEQEKENRLKVAAQQQAANSSIQAYSEAYLQLDMETQCAVSVDGGACHGLLSCRYHSWHAKRSVRGRSAPFDQLLSIQQAKAAAAHDKPFELRGPRPDQESSF